MSQPLTLILASASPRRSELLRRMGLRFAVRPAAVDEHVEATGGASELVLSNARLKAAAVSRVEPGHWVLGADTTVELEGAILGKPNNMDEARSMLRRLSDHSHRVHTGICLARGERVEAEGVETSEVTFRPLDEAAIDAYFKCVDPLDKAGAYGIQQGREMIIAGLSGSLHNVMGLPTEYLEQILHSLGLWGSFHTSARP